MRAGVVIAVWMVAVTVAAQPSTSTRGRVVTLSEALRTAAVRQPSVRKAQSQTAAARARTSQAQAPLWPQLSASASYERRTKNSSGALIPGMAVADPDFDTVGRFNFGVSASQLIYDFGGTTGRVDAAEASAEAQRANERTNSQQVAQAVRAAFFDTRAAKSLLAVAEETLANLERHVSQIDAFVRAGARAEVDLLEAKTNRANARVDVINAQNGYATAKAQLNQAMGVVGSEDYDVAQDGMPEVDGEDGPLDPLVARAIHDRPELSMLARQQRAQELSLGATRGGYWPSLSVGTGLTESGGAIDNLAWNWNAGATLSWRFFEGGSTNAQLDEARASLAGLSADVEALRQRIRLEVERARLAVRAAKAALAAGEEAVTSARERLRLSEARYVAGVGSALELSDAQLALSATLAQQVRGEYALAAARASLLLALGRD